MEKLDYKKFSDQWEKGMFIKYLNTFVDAINTLESKCASLQENDANRELDLFSLKAKCARLEDELKMLRMKTESYALNNILSPEKKETKECGCYSAENDTKIETFHCEMHGKPAPAQETPKECEHQWYPHLNGMHRCAKCPAVKEFTTSAAPEKTLARKIRYAWDNDDLPNRAFASDYFSNIAEAHYKERFDKAINHIHWHDTELDIISYMRDELFAK